MDYDDPAFHRLLLGLGAQISIEAKAQAAMRPPAAQVLGPPPPTTAAPGTRTLGATPKYRAADAPTWGSSWPT
eukprot:2248144-Heterocapsa_arctica.AAC.1